jgi:two-component system, OmpR family, phosphate regulon sensor histidine kinase PhoR
MPRPPDHAGLVNGLHSLVQSLETDRSGLPALTRLLSTAGTALGAAGMSLSEHYDDGGRVVAATGELAWTVGRPADDRPPDGAETWEVGVDSAGDDLSLRLREGGRRRLVGTCVPRRGGPDSALYAYFTDTDQPVSDDHHRMLRFVGFCATALYASVEGLPVATSPPAATPDRDLFLTVTSHELRTPVTVIKGYAQTLDQHWDILDPGARRAAVGVIRQRAGELANLVDRLLNTAVDAGMPRRGPFDLVVALRDAIYGLRPELRQRLRVNLPASLPAAHGDRASVAPVLAELVTNAAKYSAGEVRVRAAADHQTVLFQVTDRGPGIAPDHVERAFTRYWQADPGDRREAPGVGLGLHLVRRIVERQRGWVSLRPRRSGGTVAEVRLLRADTASDEARLVREG